MMPLHIFKLVLILSLVIQVISQYTVVTETDTTHCMEAGQPLLLPDPFPPEEQEDSQFITLTWTYKVHENATASTYLDVVSIDGQPVSRLSRVEAYQYWGLQVKDITSDDTGMYRALLLKKNNGGVMVVYNVVAAAAPKLKTSELSVSRKEDKERGVVDLSCGTIASLGVPPVQLAWEAPNGTLLDGTFKDGNLSLTISMEEDEGTFQCKLLYTSDAVDCLSSTELDRWEGSYVSPVQAGSDIEDKSSNTPNSTNANVFENKLPDMGIIIMIVVVIAIGLIFIIVISILLVKRCRKGAVYKTKDEEAKKENSGNPEDDPAKQRLVVQDDDNPYDRPNANAATRERPHDYVDNRQGPSPYMVSNVRHSDGGPGNNRGPQVLPKTNKAPVAQRENSDNLIGGDGNGKPGGGRYIKRNKSKENVLGGDSGDRNTSSDDKERPTPKKRSIYLTDSCEELNKVTDAVRGGTGSGRDGGRAGESAV